MAHVTKTFHWIDYMIFIAMLVISAVIGIFYAVKDKRNQGTTNFLLGGRKMSVLPVTLSLMASFLSAILLLGVPAEVFYHGTMYSLIMFSNVLTFPVAAHAFLPVFHRLGITSAYEYLEMRFNRSVRIVGSLVFQIEMIVYMGVVLYAPAIAVNQVMGIDILVSILLVGTVCTFYTAIGGLKAVMWTDAFQMLVVFGGLLAVVMKGTSELGGPATVWDTASRDNRIQLVDFDPSPLSRHTFWTLVVGGFVTSMTIYGSNQAMIQRYLSMDSVRKAQTALYLQLPASIIFTAVLTFAGLVLYARYHDNDPLQACIIDKRDQLIPWLVMDVLGNYHGFPGLLVACIFSASLSTVSSGVNALALSFLTDIVKPGYKHVVGQAMTDRLGTILSKVLAIVFGMVTIGLAFLAQKFGSLILQVALSIFGVIGGPLLGLFVAALFFPIINAAGALAGVICSLGVTAWVAVGSIVYRSRHAPPPSACPGPGNYTLPTPTSGEILQTSTSTVIDNVDDTSGLVQFYHLSYLWYSSLAVLTVVVVGILVSCLTGGTRRSPVDRRLLSPWYLRLSSLASVSPLPERKPNSESGDPRTAIQLTKLGSDLNGRLAPGVTDANS